MIHHKEDFIMQDGKYFRCICADKEIAVFASVTPHRKDYGYKTHLTKLWCTGQNKSTSISNFERIYRGKFSVNFPRLKKAA